MIESKNINKYLQITACGDNLSLHCLLDGGKAVMDGTVLQGRHVDDDSIELSLTGKVFVTSVCLSFNPGVFTEDTRVFTSDGLDVLGNALSKPKLGSFFIIVQLPLTGQWLLLGIGDRGTDLSCFHYEHGQLSGGWLPERTISNSFRRKMFVWIDSDPEMLVARYQEACRNMIPEIQKMQSEPPVGWNSWDYYSAAISMESMEREMAAINASPLKGKLRYFTLDMGWENAWGEWRPNGRFPKRMEEIASIIKGYGFEPGLWIAPMQVEYLTELARFNPQVLLKDKDGNHILTTTGSPVDVVGLLNLFDNDVIDMVHGWFKDFYDAGFRMFKVDYLYRDFLACLSQCPDNQGVGKYVQNLFGAIRTAIGPDARVINCGAPKESAAGYAEIARTGYDIHNFWGHIRKCTQQIIGHYWQNHLLWINDPDFAIARTPSNTIGNTPLNRPYIPRPYGGDNDFWMAGPEANDTELRTWLSIVRLYAGSICFSDSIAAMTPKGIEMLSKLLPPLDSPAKPLDYFREKLPRYWRGNNVLGVFNWGDASENMPLSHLSFLPDKLRDFWTGSTVSKQQGILLEPHQGTILEFS